MVNEQDTLGKYLVGIDVSKWQGRMDWAKAKEAGIAFAYMRVSNGLAPDSQFETNWITTNDLKIMRGGYHYLQPNMGGKRQAEAVALLMQQATHDGDFGDLPLALDVETSNSLFPNYLYKAVKEFMDTWESLTGYTPIIYTRASFWNTHLPDTDFGKYGLWVAHYGTNNPSIPDEWDDWLIHQYSADENRRGAEFGASGSHAIDLNRAKPELLGGVSEGGDPPDEEDDDTTITGVTYVEIVASMGLRFRACPSTKCEIVGGLSRGQKIPMLDLQYEGDNLWARVGKEIWVAVFHNGKELARLISE